MKSSANTLYDFFIRNGGRRYTAYFIIFLIAFSYAAMNALLFRRPESQVALEVIGLTVGMVSATPFVLRLYNHIRSRASKGRQDTAVVSKWMLVWADVLLVALVASIVLHLPGMYAVPALVGDRTSWISVYIPAIPALFYLCYRIIEHRRSAQKEPTKE